MVDLKSQNQTVIFVTLKKNRVYVKLKIQLKEYFDTSSQGFC